MPFRESVYELALLLIQRWSMVSETNRTEPSVIIPKYRRKVQRRPHDWFSERQECCSYPSHVVEGTADEWTALLGNRLLREYCWFGRRTGSTVHP